MAKKGPCFVQIKGNDQVTDSIIKFMGHHKKDCPTPMFYRWCPFIALCI